MVRRSPSVALIWMYQGKNASARLAEIKRFDYPEFEVIDAGKVGDWSRAIRAVSARIELCVFWVDDEKPVGKDFLQQMTRPLVTTESLRAVMHFWSGNALSVPKKMLDESPIDGDQAGVQSLLRLLLPVLDVTEKETRGRIHLAFSSTERVAPFTMPPLGSPS
ncbi:MAG TPA: hypothetical protein VE422_50810 [Terriglobia bacterium]|nr:hypothetical protein [Terriglobia bacterium]